ncbi:MAG: amidohydrolase [Breznakibacter sp.]|nr:amidohydrolase [Breznakibacter sp.]
MLKQRIKELIKENYEEILSIRRHIHQHPELSFEEYNTSQFVAKKLEEYGVPFKQGFVKTGIVGRIEGKNPSKRVIALRADMDALPIEEAVECVYKSQTMGVMHACGHDAHTASLLGTIKVLTQLKDEFEGTILVIFQPGEESFPGGAKLMMEEGALNDPKPELIIGQHVLPDMATGNVGFRGGFYMASGDEVHMVITGKGGHAAMPHTLTDTVLVTSHIIVALQQIVSRFVPADIPTVLSFGKVIANGATNIIPEKVVVAGTLRTFNEEWRAKIKSKIREIATATAEMMGAHVEIDIKDGYPMVFNNEEVTQKCQQFAEEFLGAKHVEAMTIRMTAEDFGYYTQAYPATFYRFGVKQDDGVATGALHTPQFNLNERSLETSSGLMAWLAINLLKG